MSSDDECTVIKVVKAYPIKPIPGSIRKTRDNQGFLTDSEMGESSRRRGVMIRVRRSECINCTNFSCDHQTHCDSGGKRGWCSTEGQRSEVTRNVLTPAQDGN
ncbi:hypothetical protein PENTCL1PPCAC_28371 [Pristionchus entomophagus]|uniref:Uncharacterized protein n=1 Tax=Pristionchus entomophagus TaxID=358040 RepID=A0AAV5UHW7_9BILA|nr:hypothetical protein PENTCL1PPCAC_28371 [Pristionchus entomophagus]